jgi:hypothetical protein
MVIASLNAHVTTDTGPDRLIRWAKPISSQPPLGDETRVEICVALGDWTDNRAFATVKTQSCSRFLYFPVYIEQSKITSYSLMGGSPE